MNVPVAIVGGGIVGSALALALAQAGQQVCLIEARHPGADQEGARGRRPIALSLASERIFRGLGVWPDIAPHAAAIRMVHVSERGHFGATRIRAEDYTLTALGQVCEARYIEAALGAALETWCEPRGRLRRLCPVRVHQACPEDAGVRLQLSPSGVEAVPASIETRLLVAADGADSGLRDSYRLPVLERDYRQVALVCRVRPQYAHQGRAFERFNAQGPLALLPLVDGACAVVWSLPAQAGERLAAAADEAFLGILQEQFGNRLGTLSAVTARSSFALKLVKSRAVTGPRLAVVGNAAQQLHPVAGQGLNLGLRDAALLAELVASQPQETADPGHPELLGAYARGRRDDRRWVAGFTDFLARGVTPRFAAASALRALGLLAVDLLPPVRNALARRTMGLAGYQPRLVRGLSLEALRPISPQAGQPLAGAAGTE